MAIPIHAQPQYGGRDFDNTQLPSISTREDGFGRAFGIPSRIPFNDNLSPAAASNPMVIRGIEQNRAPPPLPPPPLVPISSPVDKSLQRFGERYREPYSPLSDSLGMEFERRNSFKSFPDEGYQGIKSFRSPNLPSPFTIQSMDHFRTHDNGIDSFMLSKLNRPVRRSNLSASVNDLPVPRVHHHPTPSTISLPHRTKQQPYLDTSLTQSPAPLSAVSPFNQSSTNAINYQSPLGSEIGDYERSPIPQPRRTDSGSAPDDASTQASYDIRDDEADFPMETSRMRTLNIEDHYRRERDWDRNREIEYSQTGQKRRASSPPSDDIPLASNGVRRREGPLLTRGSPTPRLTVIPQGSSLSSLSSASRSASYVSSLTASSMTSLGLFGRRSPNSLSPGSLSPTDPSSPYTIPISVTTSPHSALSRSIALQSPHQRTMGEHTLLGATRLTSPRKHVELVKNPSSLVAAKMKGPYMCECCPKKPKKFDTEEELKIHEAEKQYECRYCGNRFKNKNEAERHQKSLHVRRHSWSCSALTGYKLAFHNSTTRPGEADTCGYCGEEFTDQNWEDRIRHLEDVHKFSECNSSKKFYRADHFRQHLKHSHAGTSGKWTNMLENACIMEEALFNMGSLLTPADLDNLKRENGTFDWPKLMRLQRGGDWDPKKHDPCDLLKHGDLDNEEFWNGEFGCELRLEYPTEEEKAEKRRRERPYRCLYPNCDKAFTRQSHLTQHEKEHPGERLYHCLYPNCDEAFAREFCLKRHERTHTRERPYRCLYPNCHEAFGEKQTLERHQRRHTGERPYHCLYPNCDKAFARRFGLKRHKRLCH